MTVEYLKQIQNDVRTILLREQVHNALIIRRREFVVLSAEADLTKLRQEIIAKPDMKEELEKKITGIKQQIEIARFKIEETKMTQQELGMMMKKTNIDSIIDLLVLPEG